MTMYLVLSAFTSSPISLLATTKASAFSLMVCTLPHDMLNNHHNPEGDVYHLISSHIGLPERF
jgi:hypothetical protein